MGMDVDDEVEKQLLGFNNNSYRFKNGYYRRPLGLCGLKNLGNTCFMNSALQCLSNVSALTDYFLTNSYLEQVTIREHMLLGTVNRPSSARCNLVRAYADLMRDMWLGGFESVRPQKLK